jgi:hypothetical protein
MVVVQRDRGDSFANHDEYRPVIDSRSDLERRPEQVARAGRRSLVGCLSRPARALITAAMLDRLLHKGIVCPIDGPSYRMRSHQARAETLRRAVAP